MNLFRSINHDIFFCSYGDFTNSTGAINRAVIVDMPQYELKERSPPPPYYSPPSYSQSPPPAYNAVVNTGPDGEHAVTSLSNQHDLFAARPSPLPSGKSP